VTDDSGIDVRKYQEKREWQGFAVLFLTNSPAPLNQVFGYYAKYMDCNPYQAEDRTDIKRYSVSRR
jgi:hypothetical protein